MSLPKSVFAALLGASVAVPAQAQYGAQSAPPEQLPAANPKATARPGAKAGERKFDISAGARPAIIALQVAVTAKDVANIPAKLAAARALAKTTDDKFIIAQLQLQAATDPTAQMAAFEAMAASGGVLAGDQATLYLNVAKLAYNAKQDAKALEALQRVAQLDPSNQEAAILTAQVDDRIGKPADALVALQKAIALKTAAGQKPEEAWYKRAWSIAYQNKLPSAFQLTRDWVAAYPSAQNWHDSLAVYLNNSGLDDSALIDIFRLEQTNGTFGNSSEYYRFANSLLAHGQSGEAKLMLDQAIAAGKIDKTSAAIREVYGLASSKSAGDRASLAASTKTAMAASTARGAVGVGDAYLGYGDYAKAIDLYRAALTKSGGDANLINLHLGMALGKSGDKAGAASALAKVAGSQAEIAKYWTLYFAQH